MTKPVNPNDPTIKSDLSILNTYLNWVKTNSDLFTPKQFIDVQKVVECIKYIKVNIDSGFIAYALENFDKQDIYRDVRDKEHRVLRDHNKTAFHLENTYIELYKKDPNAGIHTFVNIVKEFEASIQIVTKKDRLKNFTGRLEFDGDTGCLEKRIGGGKKYAERLELGTLKIDDVVNEFFEKFPQYRKGEDENLIFSEMQKYFDEQNYFGDDINPESLRKYLNDNLDYELPEIKQKEEIKIKWDPHFDDMTLIRLGRSKDKMVQFCFEDKNKITDLLKWLNSLNIRNISKATIQEKTEDLRTLYIVRVTQKQYAAIPGEKIKIEDLQKPVYFEKKTVVANLAMTNPVASKPVIVQPTPAVITDSFQQEDPRRKIVESIENVLKNTVFSVGFFGWFGGVKDETGKREPHGIHKIKQDIKSFNQHTDDSAALAQAFNELKETFEKKSKEFKFFRTKKTKDFYQSSAKLFLSK